MTPEPNKQAMTTTPSKTEPPDTNAVMKEFRKKLNAIVIALDALDRNESASKVEKAESSINSAEKEILEFVQHLASRAQLVVQTEPADPEAPKITGSPEEIWLVYEDLDEDAAHDEFGEVGWCAQQQFQSDVRYIRADLASRASTSQPAERVELSESEQEILSESMSLEIALDFADNPRPYPSLAAPADTNGELYRALKTLAAHYRETLGRLQGLSAAEPAATASRTVSDADELARDLAAEIVQSLSDSEPTGRSMDGMDKLRGSPLEGMFVLDGDDIRSVAERVISNAIFDKRLIPAPSVAEPAKCGTPYPGLSQQDVDELVEYGVDPHAKTDCTPASAEQANCVCGSDHRKHCRSEYHHVGAGDWCGNDAGNTEASRDCGHSRACHKEDGKP